MGASESGWLVLSVGEFVSGFILALFVGRCQSNLCLSWKNFWIMQLCAVCFCFCLNSHAGIRCFAVFISYFIGVSVTALIQSFFS